MCDHIRTNGKSGWGSTRWFVFPPSIPEESEVEEFADDLVQTSQEKLAELLDRFDVVEENRKINVADIQKQSDDNSWDEFSEWFWTYLENYKYAEVVYIEKWLKYWVKIYELATKTRFVPVVLEEKNEITEEDVANAKEYPIQDLYSGDLKTVYGRLTGLCPFHDEKTPSFSIFTNDNHFYCFGCHAWGDAIDFYMRVNNVSMMEAIKVLNAKQ